jgi:hypothetical protein
MLVETDVGWLAYTRFILSLEMQASWKLSQATIEEDMCLSDAT